MWRVAAVAAAVLSGAAPTTGADAGDCSRAYWSAATATPASPHKPAALKGGAAGRTAEGAVVAVHVQGKIPTASFFNEHQSAWTSSQSFPHVKCEGAAVGVTAAPGNGDGAAGDVFALFGGQEPGGDYSHQVLGYSPSAGWATLAAETPRAKSTAARPPDAMTGVGSPQTASPSALGGVDDEGDIADAWL